MPSPPTNVPGLFAWYAADQLDVGAGLANGASAAPWADLSGNGLNLTSGTDPVLYETNAVNGLPAVLFAATSNSYLSVAAPSNITRQPITVIAALEATGGTRYAGLGPAPRFGNGTNAQVAGTSTVITGGDLSSWCVVSGVANQSRSLIRVNGTQTSSGTIDNGFGPHDAVYVGNDLAPSLGASQPFAGEIAEILFYNGALTTAQLLSVEGYLTAKYFDTLAAPTVTTAISIPTGPTSTALTGQINPELQYTSYYFQWSATPFGSTVFQTPVQYLVPGSETVTVSAEIDGLTPGLIYKFQLFATNASGTTSGLTVDFSFALPFMLQVLGAVSPWAQIGSGWNTYNIALAGMFEEVFDLVSDTGDANQTVVATLSEALSTSVAITSLPVTAVAELIEPGTSVTVSNSLQSQIYVTTMPANVGDTEILVASQIPTADYGIGSAVQLAYFPGWSTLLDPYECPDDFLPFLAQFNGTNLPQGIDPDTARALIIGESGLQRGTLASVASAVTRNLTGSQSLDILERVDQSGNENSYWFIVIVRPEEVVNVGQLIDAVNSIKPGGVQWTLVQTDGWTISQMEASQVSITALENNFKTLTGLENDRPGT